MMHQSPIQPLATIQTTPLIAALPKADLHIHQEWSHRLDRVLARRAGRQPYNWRAWAKRLLAEYPPGSPRLEQLRGAPGITQAEDAVPENFVARIEDLLEEAAADGAHFLEIRFGRDTILRPDCIVLFREAERRVQARYPHFKAEAIVTLLLWEPPAHLEKLVQTCIRLADAGLRGIDLLYQPYDTEADWTTAYRLADRLATAGLGITAHAGEVSTANIAAALQTPGLTRIGHATYAGQQPDLLEQLALSGVTVEVPLSCNVILGAASAYEAHPIHQFAEYDIPFALCTDDPVQICTTIGREYALAHALGFSPADLLAITRNAFHAAFTTDERRAALLAAI